MSKPIQTRYQGRYLHLVERDRWEYVHRLHPVVVMIACTDQDELVLVEQFRKPVDQRTIELPAGLVGDVMDQADESLASAAGRELIEETGFAAGQMTEIMRCPTSAGMSNEVAVFLFADQLERVGPGGGDASEDITVHCIARDSIEDWLSARYREDFFIDPKIYTALFWLLRREQTGRYGAP
ncbi:MAG: NUDIX hydrolase [Pseudomonadota bacterium]